MESWSNVRWRVGVLYDGELEHCTVESWSTVRWRVGALHGGELEYCTVKVKSWLVAFKGLATFAGFPQVLESWKSPGI